MGSFHELALNESLTRLFITVSVILRILRQIVCNLEPGSLAAHEYVTPCFYSRVGIKCSEWEAIDLGVCIEFCVEARTTV